MLGWSRDAPAGPDEDGVAPESHDQTKKQQEDQIDACRCFEEEEVAWESILRCLPEIKLEGWFCRDAG